MCPEFQWFSLALLAHVSFSSDQLINTKVYTAHGYFFIEYICTRPVRFLVNEREMAFCRKFSFVAGVWY